MMRQMRKRRQVDGSEAQRVRRGMERLSYSSRDRVEEGWRIFVLRTFVDRSCRMDRGWRVGEVRGAGRTCWRLRDFVEVRPMSSGKSNSRLGGNAIIHIHRHPGGIGHLPKYRVPHLLFVGQNRLVVFRL